MRIVSLLPSATEIICALGQKEHLVAVSHECDYPKGVSELPHITSSILGHDLNPQEIDDAVVKAVQEGQALYQIDGDMLAQLEPDIIVTQGLCDVCAVNQNTLDATLKFMPDVIAKHSQTITLSAMTFEGILRDMRQVAKLTQTLETYETLANQLRSRWQKLKTKQPQHKPTVLTLEWSEPPFYGGHWVPEMVEAAGGINAMGQAGTESKRTTWQAIAATDPDIICMVACGFDKVTNTTFAEELKQHPEAKHLRAVREGRVFAFDANSFFSRPAPRIVDGAEQLHKLFETYSG